MKAFFKKHVKFLIFAAVLALGFYVNHEISGSEITVSRHRLEDFPRTLGEWKMAGAHAMDDRTMGILKVDDYIMRDYTDGAGHRLSLYIGYFQSQRQGKAIHSPRQCLPGAGWSALSSGVFDIELPAESVSPIRVRKMLMAKGSERRCYLYWYQGRGRVHADEFMNKIYLIWDGLSRKRTDGALIRLSGNAAPDEESSLERKRKFIQILYPHLSKYIPE